MELLQQHLDALRAHLFSNLAQSLTIFIGLVTFLSFVRVFVPTRAARALRKVPGPPSYPVVGNLIEVFSRGYHECHKEWMATYGSVYKYVMGDTLVVVSDPDVVQQVSIVLKVELQQFPDMSCLYACKTMLAFWVTSIEAES